MDRTALVMPKSELARLVQWLIAEQYRVVAPTVREQAIVYDEIESIEPLPIGARDDQQPGRYRLEQTDSESYFDYVVGANSWKQFLFPPQATLCSARRVDGRWTFTNAPDESVKYAFLGVRACELAAIEVQDRVFLDGDYVDPIYAGRREQVFLIAVNCTSAASTCFCSSMGTGPRCESSFDLALTELEDAFLVEVGSARGQFCMDALSFPQATASHRESAAAYRQRAIDQIDRHLETEGIRDRLLDSLNHPHWDEVADRCLSCANCTMVCPTCFCSTVSDVGDLTGDQSDRVRQWESCFDPRFSYTAGGTILNDTRSRYRQWVTHKFASWQDQFGTSGCVGCGRCITWCPVGIDVTEEVGRIAQTPAGRRSLPVTEPVGGEVCEVKSGERTPS